MLQPDVHGEVRLHLPAKQLLLARGAHTSLKGEGGKGVLLLFAFLKVLLCRSTDDTVRGGAKKEKPEVN